MKLRFTKLLEAGRLARFFLSFAIGPTLLFLCGCDPSQTAPDEKEITTIEREMSHRLHGVIAKTAEKTPTGFSDYTFDLPKKPEIKIHMIAIHGGEFMMGSPIHEKGRREDEGPAHPVHVSPFWIGKFEVSWDQYDVYYTETRSHHPPGKIEEFLNAQDSELVDWVTGPTDVYIEPSFGMGTEGYPAIGMTQHGASHFCEWLSAQTGHFYRLPTEAEWEYACRAGTTTAYHFGNDEKRLGEFDFYDPDATNVGYRKIGLGKPNPWGLHDMHGNVLEWCLDHYDAKTYQRRFLSGKVAVDPLEKAVNRYPRVVRGGSWYDEAELCRSAARTWSQPDWSRQDPMVPNSIWWNTDVMWLGFRIVRPVAIPDEETLHELWNSGAVHHRKEDPIPK